MCKMLQEARKAVLYFLSKSKDVDAAVEFPPFFLSLIMYSMKMFTFHW